MRNQVFSFLTVITIIFNTLSAQNNTFDLKGKITVPSSDNEMVYLKKLNDTSTEFIPIDSTVVANNQFSFTGTAIEEPVLYFVMHGSNSVVFTPQAGNITVAMGEKNRIGGTPKNDELQAFLDLQESVVAELNTTNSKYNGMEQNEENRKNWIAEIEPLRKKIQDEGYKITKNNIKNDIGEFLMLSLYQIMPGDQIVELVSEARPKFRESETGQRLSKYMVYQNIQEGKGPYLDMTMQNPEGENVSLSDYIGKGKYVLIDFWASWCAPCIREMPRLVETYNTYKDKGFEIVGVSLDQKKQDWVSAISRLNMTWVQMSDLNGWKSLASELYGISSIPFTLLVDKEGNIIESYLYGEELNYKLKEIFD